MIEHIETNSQTSVIVRSAKEGALCRRWENCPDDGSEGPVVEDALFSGDIMVNDFRYNGLNPNHHHSCPACTRIAELLGVEYDIVHSALAAIPEPNDAIPGGGFYSMWTSKISLTGKMIIVSTVDKIQEDNEICSTVIAEISYNKIS